MSGTGALPASTRRGGLQPRDERALECSRQPKGSCVVFDEFHAPFLAACDARRETRARATASPRSWAADGGASMAAPETDRPSRARLRVAPHADAPISVARAIRRRQRHSSETRARRAPPRLRRVVVERMTANGVADDPHGKRLGSTGADVSGCATRARARVSPSVSTAFADDAIVGPAPRASRRRVGGTSARRVVVRGE